MREKNEDVLMSWAVVVFSPVISFQAATEDTRKRRNWNEHTLSTEMVMMTVTVVIWTEKKLLHCKRKQKKILAKQYTNLVNDKTLIAIIRYILYISDSAVRCGAVCVLCSSGSCISVCCCCCSCCACVYLFIFILSGILLGLLLVFAFMSHSFCRSVATTTTPRHHLHLLHFSLCTRSNFNYDSNSSSGSGSDSSISIFLLLKPLLFCPPSAPFPPE